MRFNKFNIVLNIMSRAYVISVCKRTVVIRHFSSDDHVHLEIKINEYQDNLFRQVINSHYMS